MAVSRWIKVAERFEAHSVLVNIRIYSNGCINAVHSEQKLTWSKCAYSPQEELDWQNI